MGVITSDGSILRRHMGMGATWGLILAYQDQRGMRWEGATGRRACTTGGFIKPHSFPLRPGRIALSLGWWILYAP